MKLLNSQQTVIDLNTIQRVYFLGIGGIGMSALARYFKTAGKDVAGYDRTATGLTYQLEAEGIAVHFEDSPGLIPEPYRKTFTTLVVYTPAIPADHTELLYFRSRNFPVFKRSEILGMITRQRKTLAVAGTHGKTTVSTMIAHLLTQAGPGCSAFLGGISRNFGSNLVLNPKSDLVVVEADEFDRSFLQLYPWFTVVTAMDPDHLDIYGDLDQMIRAFNRFISQTDRQGFLLMKPDLPVEPSVRPNHVFTYSLQGRSDFYADHIRLLDNRYHFDLQIPGKTLYDISLVHPGLVNVENAVAACAAAYLLGLPEAGIRNALEIFSGIQRRFEYHINTEKLVYVDDYAHHPREIEATLKSLRALYPHKKLTGVFQPHLYSRTRDLADDFAKSLNLLDELILLDIYPARELPIEGVSSELLFNRVNGPEKIMCRKEELLDILKKRQPEVLITLGAGDIDKLAAPIVKLYSSRYPT